MLVGLALVVGAGIVWQGSEAAPDSGTDFVLDAFPEGPSVGGVLAVQRLHASQVWSASSAATIL